MSPPKNTSTIMIQAPPQESRAFNYRLYLQHASHPSVSRLRPPIIGFSYATPRGGTPTSFQAPPLSVHQGEAGLMTAPAIVRGAQGGVAYSVALETVWEAGAATK